MSVLSFREHLTLTGDNVNSLCYTHLVMKEQLKKLLETASRAPSVHNSQPWQVIVMTPEKLRVELRQDIALPYADPTGRGGWMAIGAFVENFSIAARTEGFEVTAECRDAVVTVELTLAPH